MIGAIIQARMTSTRLPGKVLKPVMGRPLFEYMTERLLRAKKLDTIVVATTTNDADEPIVAFAKKQGLAVFRGSEQDVLSRYHGAAKAYGINHVVRVTSDCPLIDPVIVDRAITRYGSSGCDYLHLGTTFAEGLDTEVFSFTKLAMAHEQAKLRAEREHVSLYFHNNPEKICKEVIENDTDDSRYRITVDEPQDFEVVKAVFESLYTAERPLFHIEDIKSFLDKHPHIFAKNSHIIRNEGLLKSLSQEAAAAKAAAGTYAERIIGDGGRTKLKDDTENGAVQTDP